MATTAKVNIDERLKQGLDLLAKHEKIDKACKLINLSARKGTSKGKSFFAIGEILRKGIEKKGKVELEAQVEESRIYFDQAMDDFVKTTQDNLDLLYMGDYYRYGLGTQPVDLTRALEFYEKSADSGNADAPIKAEEVRRELATGSANVAPILTATAPVATEEVTPTAEADTTVPVASTTSDEVEAPTVKEAPAIGGDAGVIFADVNHVRSVVNSDATLVRGLRLLDSAVSTDEERLDGINLIKTAEEQGSLRASVLLGYLYETGGSNLPKDLLESKKHYEVAIGKGSATAEYRLGLLYLDSNAPFFNQERGHELIVSSARHGYSYALNYIGDCYRSKVSNPKNLETAYRYYALAGERGLGLAYHNMAEIDSSRQEFDLASTHEKYALYHGYDRELGIQDPLFFSVHI